MEVQPNTNVSLENRPGVFMIGSPGVGKRSLLSRLLSVDFEDASDSLSEVLAHGWTIDTKYYTADVSVWMAHLHNEFSIGSLPIYKQLAALLMVFDMNDLSSFAALQEWVSSVDIQKFDILLCIGNKADLLPGHSAHAEYRRRLQKSKNSFMDGCQESLDYGISETEGSSLLGDEEAPWEIRRSCLEWCSQHNIEYIESCASNADFDKCLSVDGDLQGVERLYGALSAHMWPGMILKSGNKTVRPSIPDKQELSEEESDYEFDYEILSAGSAEPWDDTDEGWVSANGLSAAPCATGPVAQSVDRKDSDHGNGSTSSGDVEPSTSTRLLKKEANGEEVLKSHETDKVADSDSSVHFDFEELEQLMTEIGGMRDSLRLVPDSQRREMAASLALKMAAMFGGGSDDEEVD